MSARKTYLGDGVYADFDNYNIVLTTEDGVSVTNRIYLERAVFDALTKFVATLIAEHGEEAP